MQHHEIDQKKTLSQTPPYNLYIKKALKINLSKAFLFNLAVPTFPARRQASIIGAVDFTSVFGMGTGVSLQLFPPEIFYFLITLRNA